MSPAKQAKSQGNSGKEPKLNQVTEWRKKLWENPGSVWGQFSSGQHHLGDFLCKYQHVINSEYSFIITQTQYLGHFFKTLHTVLLTNFQLGTADNFTFIMH